jgi:hypothetical protein
VTPMGRTPCVAMPGSNMPQSRGMIATGVLTFRMRAANVMFGPGQRGKTQ